jgi:hypothetical protein
MLDTLLPIPDAEYHIGIKASCVCTRKLSPAAPEEPGPRSRVMVRVRAVRAKVTGKIH